NDTFERNLATVDDFKDKFISMLEGHVIFLEEEIRHKNTIIESLIQTNRCTFLQGKGQNQNSVSNSNKEITRKNTFLPTNQSKSNNLEQANEFFQIPKRTSKNVQTKHGEAITLENRFNPLQVNDKINESSDERESNVANSENITERKKRKRNRGKTESRRYVAIIGDSILKEVKGHLLSTPKENVVVKSFSGATTTQMYDYSKPTLEMKPDQLVIHVGTNDLKKTSNNDEIVDNIVKLALHCYNSNE
uniref:Scavenger receptor cysteine-rich type 1 M130 n=1 Tax=Clytia hemisphaerica TaxID=252671 RepID=A0A7M5XM38_9CNID